MSIATFSDLVAEIRDEMDDDGYSLDKIKRALTRAEAIFNRELRVPMMETQLTLAVTTEAQSLPADYLGLRAIYRDGDDDVTLRSTSPASLRMQYGGRAGTVAAYAIEGQSIIFGPVGSATVKMLYYARIPALTAENPANWLLLSDPDLYLHQTLAILFAKTGDRERAADNLGVAMGMIEQLNNAGRKARYGAAPLSPILVTQVSGSRI